MPCDGPWTQSRWLGCHEWIDAGMLADADAGPGRARGLAYCAPHARTHGSAAIAGV